MRKVLKLYFISSVIFFSITIPTSWLLCYILSNVEEYFHSLSMLGYFFFSWLILDRNLSRPDVGHKQDRGLWEAFADHLVVIRTLFSDVKLSLEAGWENVTSTFYWAQGASWRQSLEEELSLWRQGPLLSEAVALSLISNCFCSPVFSEKYDVWSYLLYFLVKIPARSKRTA
jgi:hypothetical protein